jgi:hypothetical protein
MELNSSNSTSTSSGSIHLDVRRSRTTFSCCPHHYHHHHHATSSSSGGRISSSSSSSSSGTVTLSVTGNKVDPVHVERALAYLSCHPGACPPLVRLSLTQTCLYDNKNNNNVVVAQQQQHGSGNSIIMKRLRQVFSVHKMLQTVDFSWNHLGHNGNAGLVQVLQAIMGPPTGNSEESSSSSSIQQLFLYGNDICDTPDLKVLGDLIIGKKKNEIADAATANESAATTDTASTAPSGGIGGYSGLRELHLGSNTLLGMHCARALARGLSHPTQLGGCSLVELDLWCCRLGDDAGAVLIRDGVSKNNSVEVLRLNLNDLSYKSCRAMTEMLAVNQTLQVLNLDSNDQLFSCCSNKRKKSNSDNDHGGDADDVYDAQAHHAIGLGFAQVLGKKNTGLRHLGLPNTGITDAIAVAMFQNLEPNDTLHYLDIGYNNDIDSTGYAQMIESMPKLQCLQYLRTHARSQIMNVPQLVKHALRLNTSLLRLTYICVGSAHDQNQMDDYFKRNTSLLRARALVKSCRTTRHTGSNTTSIQQSPEEACSVPLGLWTMALHKFAKAPASSSQKLPLPTLSSASTCSSTTSISALYTLVQGQAPTWIQQYQQAKQEAAEEAAAAATRKEEDAAAVAAALQIEAEEEANAAALQTSTFKIKSRQLSNRRLL